MKNFFNKLIQYLALFKSMLIDSLWKFKWRAFLVLISGFLGVTFQVQAIGLAIYYARVMEKGGIVKLLGYEFQARTSLGLLSLSAFAVLASLILSAWLIYFF